MHVVPVREVTGDSVLSMTTMGSTQDCDVFLARQCCCLGLTVLLSRLDSFTVRAQQSPDSRKMRTTNTYNIKNFFEYTCFFI